MGLLPLETNSRDSVIRLPISPLLALGCGKRRFTAADRTVYRDIASFAVRHSCSIMGIPGGEVCRDMMF
jgi:hypothetical protein